MKITRVIALAVIVASAGVAMTHAQSLRKAVQPAEFPPSSYNGTQYVDSRGCVYVRAGISGNVTWVPRVTRSRQQICGQSPSIAGAVASTAPKVKPSAKPVQITLGAAKAPTAIAPVIKPVAKTAKPKVRKTAAVVAVPKTKRVRVIEPAPVKKPVVIAATSVKRKVVRIQPPAKRVVIAQPTRRTVTVRRVGVAEASTISGATRVVPKHVYENRQNTQNLRVPKGYRTVWEDDRLNPKRAEQSIAGQAQINLVWTRTVPRRLVDTTSGRDVTASTPLVYPYVDRAVQARDLGTVSIVHRDGQVLKRIVRNADTAKVRQPVVSSRSAPTGQLKKTKALAAQYVQVGTFGQQDNAQTAAKRIKRMGLPVRIGKYTRSGKTYRIVLAGPFGSDAARALAKLRAAGYKGAALRR